MLYICIEHSDVLYPHKFGQKLKKNENFTFNVKMKKRKTVSRDKRFMIFSRKLLRTFFYFFFGQSKSCECSPFVFISGSRSIRNISHIRLIKKKNNKTLITPLIASAGFRYFSWSTKADVLVYALSHSLYKLF